MISPNRASAVPMTALTLVGVTLALAFLQGCGSGSKPAPAAAAPPPPPPPQPVSLAQMKTELMESQAQLQATTDALNQLAKSSAADAQANYNRFSQEFMKLQTKSDAVSKRATDLKAKASDYYAMWNRQVEVQNPELRRQAIQQKVNAEQVYTAINNEMELARLSFQPYMANLRDVGTYLKDNLNPATLNSVSELVTKANAQSKEVDGHITAIVGAMDKIMSATGEGAAGPTTRTASK